ncbi:ABC transporter substrate-binding protein [Clostridia bacterium]|nr:ABC transporter substrate-binding protein [Clostridia bacterium]
MKRILLLTLVCMLAFGCALADPSVLNTKSIMPIVTEPITLRVAAALFNAHVDYDKMYMYNLYEEMTGIHIDWDLTPQENWNERKNLMLSSDDLPDVFLRGSISQSEAVNYGAEQGMLLNIKPLLEEYAPNFYALAEKYTDVWATITVEDGVYTLPQLIPAIGPRSRSVWIHEGWLSAAELAMPDTVEDFYNLAVAFKNLDWNKNGQADEYPISWDAGRLGDVFGNFSSMFGMMTLGSQAGNIDLDENGSLRFYPVNERYKEMLRFMNKLWEEDLVDQDSLTQSSAQVIVKADEGTVGIYPALNGPYFLGKDAVQYAAMPAVENQWGERMWNNANNIVQIFGSFAITNRCANPEAALRWADYFYSEEGVLLIFFGTEGYTFDYGEDGRPHYTPLVMDESLGLTTNQLTGRFLPMASSMLPLIQLPELAYDVTEPNEFRRQESGRIHEADIPEKLWSPIFSSAAQSELSPIAADINTYITEMRMKFMTGAANIDTDWDAYVQRLETMGMAQYIDLYQSAYDLAYSN